MFVPPVHPPGHAQADFGESIGIDRRERGDVLSVAPGVLVRYRLNDYSVPTT
jgi:hypothetical protein